MGIIDCRDLVLAAWTSLQSLHVQRESVPSTDARMQQTRRTVQPRRVGRQTRRTLATPVCGRRTPNASILMLCVGPLNPCMCSGSRRLRRMRGCINRDGLCDSERGGKHGERWRHLRVDAGHPTLQCSCNITLGTLWHLLHFREVAAVHQELWQSRHQAFHVCQVFEIDEKCFFSSHSELMKRVSWLFVERNRAC